MKILYEPVAVRCKNRIFLALLPQKGDKPLDFSEKAKNVHRVEILADKIVFITASAGVCFHVKMK